MILLLAIVVGLLAGLIRGGRLVNLAGIRIRAGWVPLVLFPLQLVVVQFPPDAIGSLGQAVPIVVIASQLVLLAFLWINRSLTGAKLLILGTVLNLTVMLANGGYMPVTVEALRRSGHVDRVVVRGGRSYVLGSKDIVLSQGETRFYPLSDVMGIPEELPFSTNFSLGDLAIAAGAAALVYRGVGGGRSLETEFVGS